MATKKITKKTLNDIIDKSHILYHYAEMGDMDLCEIDDLQTAAKELLGILGEIFDFDPYIDDFYAEDEDYDDDEEDDDDDEEDDDIYDAEEKVLNSISKMKDLLDCYRHE